MKYLLGIELNGDQLKISALKKSGQSCDLYKLDSFYFANEESEAVSQLSLWKERNLHNTNFVKAVLTVSESLLYIKEIEIPKVKVEQIAEVIYWEIPSITPISQTEAVFDWKVISEGKDTFRVLVVVSKTNYIENLISIFAKAQIEIIAIEPSSCALSRITDVSYSNNALLCMAQDNNIDFVILKKGIPVFTTSATVDSQAGKNSKVRTEKDLTSQLSLGAKKIITYWESKEETQIQQIVLTGDVIYKYYGLESTVNLYTNQPVFLAKNKKFKSLKTGIYKDLDIARYLISLGASVRHLQKDVFDGINLFPASEKLKAEKARREKKLTENFLKLIGINLFFVIVTVVSIFVLNMWWYSLEKQLDGLNRLSSNHPANSYIKEIDATNQTIQNSILLIKQQKDAGDRLRLISNMTPQTVKLKSISLSSTKSEEWIIEGVGDRDSILAFYENVSQSPGVSSISMPYSNFNKEKDNEFSITIIW